MSKKTIKYKSISLIFILIGLIMIICALFFKIKNTYYLIAMYVFTSIGIGYYISNDKMEKYE